MTGGKRYRKEPTIEKMKKRCKVVGAQFFLSVISLVLVVAVFVTGSVAWFTIKTSKLNAGKFTLECGKGLRVNDSGTSDFQLTNVNKYIIPASSVDGRNLYFPADGTDFSRETEEMTFRNSTVGDKNENYVQIDFTLTAQANNTALYINDLETSIKVERENVESTTLAAPLRLALWSSTAADGYPNTPIVFNPTGKTYTVPAVQVVDRASGSLQSTGAQVSHAFTDYAYGGEPIATLSKGVETKFSLILWLEGTDPKCTYSKMQAQDIHLKIAFTTSWDKTQVIRFKDATGTNGTTGWVKEKIAAGYTLSLHYEDYDTTPTGDVHEETDFNMYPYNQTGNDLTGVSEWMCNMPGDMHKNITFMLTGKETEGGVEVAKTYKFCRNSKDNGATDTYNRGVNRVYVAEESSAPTGNAMTTCKGYWKDLGDSDGGGHDGGDIDGDDF